MGKAQAPVTKTRDELSEFEEKLLEPISKKFDLRTRIVNPKTGVVIRWQPYSYVVSKENGEEYFLRDGKRWNRNGVEIGAAKPVEVRK